MAPSSTLFDATTQDIENLLAAQAHMGSKNLQVSVFYIGWDIGTDVLTGPRAGSHGPLCVEDQARWCQHYQYWEDLVS